MKGRQFQGDAEQPRACNRDNGRAQIVRGMVTSEAAPWRCSKVPPNFAIVRRHSAILRGNDASIILLSAGEPVMLLTRQLGNDGCRGGSV